MKPEQPGPNMGTYSKKSIDSFGFIVYTCFTESVKGRVSVKASYSEMQYAQLAVDQFCRAINQVPFVSDVEIRIAGPLMEYGDYIVSVHFSDSDEIQKELGLSLYRIGQQPVVHIAFHCMRLDE